MTLSPWDGYDIAALLAVEPIGSSRWRTKYGDANVNGRCYGGQLLGQALSAALMDVPPGREATAMQFLFLQGALPEEAIDLQVTTLQEGKRFSSRHVRGSQANGRIVLDAHATCAQTQDAPSHTSKSVAPADEHPERLPRFDEVDSSLVSGLMPLGGYPDNCEASIDFRVPDPSRQLSASTMDGAFRFWMRTSRGLPDNPRVHAAAFAFLSDWWLNFSSLGLHLRNLGDRRLYVASLNHTLWLHRPFRADQWLHVLSSSQSGANGRALSIGLVHDLDGRHVATITQECLLGYGD